MRSSSASNQHRDQFSKRTNHVDPFFDCNQSCLSGPSNVANRIDQLLKRTQPHPSALQTATSHIDQLFKRIQNITTISALQLHPTTPTSSSGVSDQIHPLFKGNQSHRSALQAQSKNTPRSAHLSASQITSIGSASTTKITPLSTVGFGS